MIRLGVCAAHENAGLLKALGYDYIELALGSVAALSEEDFQTLCSVLNEADLPCEALNCMLPGEIPVVGPAVNWEKVDGYLAHAYARAARLGAKVLVFGSGGSRQVPEGFDRAAAWRQLREFLVLANRHAAVNGLKIAIEPLRRAECNILNTVSEAVELDALVDLPQIGALGDTYHMGVQGEALDALQEAGALLFHVHVSEPENRFYPKPGDGGNYAKLFWTLHAAGYQGRVSIEGSAEDLPADAKTAFALLDSLRSLLPAR